MTELLKDLMTERADSLGDPDLDVLRMVREGNRRVVLRRTKLLGVGVAAVAAAAVIAAVTLPNLRTDGGASDLISDGTDASPHALSWASGSTIHTASTQIDVGHPIRSYVQTDAGYVFTTPTGDVYAWLDDKPDLIGTLATVTAGDSDVSDLVADASSVAWVDLDHGYSVVDLAANEAWSEDTRGGDSRVTAFDGDTVWIDDSEGVAAWSYRDGTIEKPGPEVSAAVVDSEQGILLLNGDGEKNDAIVGATSITVEVDAWGNLSPDGTLASVEHNDEGFIVDAATGEKQPFNHGHEWALAFDWINDTHVATMVFDGIDDQESMVGSLVDCDTTAGTCETVLDELPAIGSFQLPIGLHLGGE